ncbi:hypothetical protein C8Q75DRAFT_622338 [Abortiporus biennis]|nr:hypothetical protein C8Q75DRAFT_622338 [Abortiporus biennis]
MSRPSSPVLKALRQRHSSQYPSLRFLSFSAVISLTFLWYKFSNTRGTKPYITALDETPAQDNRLALMHNFTPDTDIFLPPKRQFPIYQYQHENNTGPLETSLAILYPITSQSLSHAPDVLSMILTARRPFCEVAIISSQELHSTIRDILRTLLTSSSTSSFVETSIYSWPVGLSEQDAILTISRELYSDEIMILDTSAHGSLHPLDFELLLNSPASLLPRGLLGFSIDGTGTPRCRAPSTTAQPVSFVRPPFILWTTSIPPINPWDSEGQEPWLEFARSIPSIRTNDIGGILIGVDDPERFSCYDFQEDKSSTNTSDKQDMQLTETGNFILIFPDLRDLRRLYPLVCRLQQHGHSIQALVSSEYLAKDAERATYQRSSPQSSCDVKITVFPESDTLDEQLYALVDWLNLNTPDVLLSPIDETGHHLLLQLMELAKANEELLFSAVTHIQIPISELPFTDWMSSLSLHEWRNWYKPKIDISIITKDRPLSLKRLLYSLSTSLFFGDKHTLINIRINLEQTSDEETRSIVDDFISNWTQPSSTHGHHNVFIHRRVIHGGLLPAVVESWYPTTNHSYGLLLEDDVELSPLFYAWLKMTLLKYRYGGDQKDPHLFGISLYQLKNLELRPEGRHRFNSYSTFSSQSVQYAQNTPFLSQIPCSWGALYFPEQWKEFHDFLAFRLSILSEQNNYFDANTIIAPGLRSNKWLQSWKKFFIEMTYLKGYMMLYPNYPRYTSLSTNHLEIGSHVKDVPKAVYEKKRRLFLLPLMQLPSLDSRTSSETLVETGLLNLPNERIPRWEELPVLDLMGLLTDQTTIVERGKFRGNELVNCEDVDEDLAHVRKWFCP